MPALAIVDDAVITREVWDRLVQSLVFFGDSVSLRASYRPGPGVDGARLRRLLSDLHEMGIVRFWAHEYEVDDRLALRTDDESAPGARHKVDLVANPSFLRENMGRIDEDLRWNRAAAYESGAMQQGIGEVIAFRHMLTSSMVTRAIGSNGLMMARSAATKTPFGLPTTFSEAVAQRLRETLTIPPLDLLDAAQIGACRPYSEGFRLLLEKEIGATPANAAGDLSSSDVADRLLRTHADVSSHLAESFRSPASRKWRVATGTLVSTVASPTQVEGLPALPPITVATPAHGLFLLNQLSSKTRLASSGQGGTQ